MAIEIRDYNILSLGAGVQSTAVLLMSEKGILPPLDVAIFADTGWEPAAVYTHLKWLQSTCKTPIAIVSNGHIREDLLRSHVRGTHAEGKRAASLPLFVLSPEGKRGMIRRQCTGDYKIKPVEKHTRRSIIGLRKYQKMPKGIMVHMWMGISADEATRMRTSAHKWQTNTYPLLNHPQEMLPRDWHRQDCLDWLAHEYPNQPIPRSACIGCPFRSNNEWRDLTPEEMQDAIFMDAHIRDKGGPSGELFLHSSRVPLSEVDFTPTTQPGWDDECAGICGV